METFTLRHLTFFYPKRARPALSDVTLSVFPGQFMVLMGRSGCGKTTLLRHLNPGLAPHGRLQGELLFHGRPIAKLPGKTACAQIGFVFQDPDNQIVTDTVWHELAFGLESLGIPAPEIRARVAEMASFFGIEGWFHKKVSELSGGQKQLLNLASVMVMHPSVLILDEPTGQLDPIAALHFLELVQKINRELGITVLLAEHRLEEALPMADRVIVLEGGKVAADDSPEKVLDLLRESGHDLFCAMPTPMRVWSAVPNPFPCPVTVRSGRAWLADYAKIHPPHPRAFPMEETPPATAPVLSLQNIWFRREKDAPDVLKDLSLHVQAGEIFALLGGNGTGKTTALSVSAGLCTPYRGQIRLFGKPVRDFRAFNRSSIALLPQDPGLLFTQKTLEEDLFEGLRDDSDPAAQAMRELIDLCGLSDLLHAHPFDLSGGEKQRAALAKVLCKNPRILMLDEPTKGLDAHFRQTLGNLLSRLTRRGTAVFLVSHDVEFCAHHADRCALLFDGAVISEGPPRRFFCEKRFYTTAANRMARGRIDHVLLPEDIIAACGGTHPANPDHHRQTPEPPHPPRVTEDERFQCPPVFASPDHAARPAAEKATRRPLLFDSWVFFLLIPLTIYAGMTYLNDRKYYFISLLIILEALIPFALLYERRNPRLRELVVLAVYCAIGACGRAAFFMLPQMKPLTALVVIGGIAFGSQAGFLIGAVSVFLSNMFFGQGPWTPWQMLAFGLIGFLSGLVFRFLHCPKKPAVIALFGAFCALIVFGGIMNSAEVLIRQPTPTGAMFLVAFGLGLPFDLIHAGTTAALLYFAANPMIEKLDRIRIKYGLNE